jgi:hypothetical protein
MRYIIKPSSVNGEPEYFLFETCSPAEGKFEKQKLIARVMDKSVAEFLCRLMNENTANCAV